jgi:lysophospholipid acyltransferase (LPLAT)-like uncharacterized protein
LPQIEIGVDVVEALGSETIVYGKTRREETGDDSLQRSLEEDKSNVTAKVDSRSTTKAGDKIKIALDIIHCHLFDAENELTILARSLEHKAEIEAMQNQYDNMMSENPTDFVVEYTEEDPEGSIEKAVPQDSKKKKK